MDTQRRIQHLYELGVSLWKAEAKRKRRYRVIRLRNRILWKWDVVVSVGYCPSGDHWCVAVGHDDDKLAIVTSHESSLTRALTAARVEMEELMEDESR